MKKRLLSMLLALCMVLVALPVFALAVIAEEGEAEATVSISFCLPDGTEVCKRTAAPGVVNFELPTDDEIAAALAVYNAKEEIKGKYELTAEDILGFYDVSGKNVIAEAGAYSGTIINKDTAFYAFTTKSVFKPGNNWPRYTDKTSFDGYRGGWSVGYYSNGSKKVIGYTSFDAANNILNAGNTWGQGGLYVAADPHMVTCADNSAALIWKAIAPGTIDIGMEYLGFSSSNVPEVDKVKPTSSDIAFAIAKNGVIVWPKAAAGAIADTWSSAGKDAETNKWYYMKSETLTQDMTKEWNDYCTENEDAPTGITVAAGDEIQFILKKVTTACVTCYPTVTYTEVTDGVDAEAAGIVTAFDTKYVTGLDANTNYPTFPEVAEGKEVVFHGNWDFVQYNKAEWGDATRAIVKKITNVLSGDNPLRDAFITANGVGGWGTATGTRIPSGNTAWGNAGAVSSQQDYTVGYRYTAEYTGLANIVLTEYFINADTNPKDAVLGIFVNGQMVWPAVGDYYTDTSKWATVTTTKQTATNLPTDLLITKGDMIEVLFGAPNGYIRGATVMPVSVNYTELYNDPEVSVNGTLNENDAYDLSLTVNPGGMDEVKVEVADDKSGTMSNYVELTGTDGVYTPDSYARLDYAPYTVTFRVTMGTQGKTISPKYVSYTILSRYAPLVRTGFGLKENVPLVADGKATFQGGWDFVIYDTIANIGTSAGKVAGTVFTSNGATFFADAAYTVGNPEFQTGFSYVGDTWGGATYGAYVRGNTAASWRYTAEDSGLADITLDKLGHTLTTWEYDMGYAIFLNGEKIWPTADTAIDGVEFKDGWLRTHGLDDGAAKENLLTAEQLAAANAQLKNIYLRKGDTLEFVCRALGNSDNWSNCGNVCYASVDYTTRNETELPAYKGIAATIGSKYGFTILTEGENANIEKLELALTYASGRTLTIEAIADLGGFRVGGILPAEMTEKITYKLYAVSTNGTVKVHRLLTEGETNYATLLSGYLTEDVDVKTKDLVIATLQYGAAMQKRTLHNMDNLATSVLGEEDVLSFTLTDPESVYAQEKDATKAYTFTGASLLLQDEIRVKLYIELAEGMEMSEGDLFLEYATSADFTGAQRSAVVQRGNEGETWRSNAHLKAILDVMPSAFTGAMYFRVVTADGIVVSTTLTYSVDSYAARVPAEAEMTAAIRALGIATANYLADEA